MNVNRILTLFLKDLQYGSRNFIFVFAIVLPLVLSLVIGLLFGTLFNERPKLGIVDAGESQLTEQLLAADFLVTQTFATQEDLLAALDTGAVEMGLVLPADFDSGLREGTRTDLTFYVWGQTLLRNRSVITAAVMEDLVDMTGRETPVNVDVVLVGDRASQSWQQRLLPVVVLVAVVFGGVMVPATSLVEERTKRTLTAITTTPMTMAEVLLTKGLMGVILSVFSGLAILTLNGGWGPNPLLLLLVLALSGTFAAAFGVFLGSRVKDIQTLFAVVKSIGILLYAPALIALFPDVIPQWIARFFPTYYILQPVLDISQRGAGLGDVAVDLLILVAMTVALIVALGATARRLQVQAA